MKIGVDLSSGGSIFWFSELPGDRNLLNHADRGRFIQQSYYGKADGSMWAKKPWHWNPVQGGDYTIHLTIGSAEEMRARFKQLALKPAAIHSNSALKR